MFGGLSHTLNLPDPVEPLSSTFTLWQCPSGSILTNAVDGDVHVIVHFDHWSCDVCAVKSINPLIIRGEPFPDYLCGFIKRKVP
jgi:hypothetical protein